jgi:hypothetical protein
VLACEAYLGGWYLEYLAVSQKPIPAWAWLNVIAHSDRDRLVAVASAPLEARTAAERAHVSDWRLTLTVLTRAVLERAPDGQRLVALQDTILVPLELALIAKSTEGHISADTLAGLVLTSLDSEPKPWRGCVEP